MPTLANQLGIIEFAKALLTTEDLDPLYVALNGVKWERSKLCRWLVAYWCYYHAGLCCWIVDQDCYWDTMMKAAVKDGFPRGTERRHFRGNLAIDSVVELARNFPHAEDVVDWLVTAEHVGGGGTIPASILMNRVKQLKGFGDWIAWKVADMLDRLDVGPKKIVFTEDDLRLMFRSSQEGAERTFSKYSQEVVPTKGRVQWAHRFVLKELGKKLKAPPLYDRPLNVQETETIFCKWKSHLNGHYPIGKDTKEIKHSLKGYAVDSPSARQMLDLGFCLLRPYEEGKGKIHLNPNSKVKGNATTLPRKDWIS